MKIVKSNFFCTNKHFHHPSPNIFFSIGYFVIDVSFDRIYLNKTKKKTVPITLDSLKQDIPLKQCTIYNHNACAEF